jgi:trehalose utilization protein
MPVRVTVWNEFRHEKTNPKAREIYPQGMQEVIAKHLRGNANLEVTTATLDEEEHGLSDERVKTTDVLIWWGHLAHDALQDLIVERCFLRVLSGMGLVVLHSGHFSKLFRKLMGTTCDLKWRESNDREIVWVTRPGHPIVKGIPDHFVLPEEETYGEYFDIPEPQETILISSFSGGEVFRSGCTWMRGAGKIFYFRPGHETHPTYHDTNVLRIIENAVQWAAPAWPPKAVEFGYRKPGWIENP